MVNSGMHKQDIMHKGTVWGMLTMIFPILDHCFLLFMVLAPNGCVIRLSLFNEDTIK